VTESDVIDWVIATCLLFGTQRSTAFKVAAEFAAAFEQGVISVDHSPVLPNIPKGTTP